FEVQVVRSEMVFRDLIDVYREVQIGAMVPDICEIERVVSAQLTFEGQSPLIVRRDRRVVLVVAYVAARVVLRVRRCRSGNVLRQNAAAIELARAATRIGSVGCRSRGGELDNRAETASGVVDRTSAAGL